MKKILKEPSTWAGLTAVITGVGQIAKINEAPIVADVITQAAPQIISNNWTAALLILAGGFSTWFNTRKKD